MIHIEGAVFYFNFSTNEIASFCKKEYKEYFKRKKSPI